jgi:dephospho-CoA kinase
MTRVVGILGGIGSGKSQVSRLLQENGAVVLSGDALGHEALREPELKARIVERWGEELLDEQGEIERTKLGGIVFADEKERRALETIVHPWIKERLRQEVFLTRDLPGVKLIVVDAAIMLEAGWDDVCDELIFVDVPRPLRLERIRRQRGWTEKEVDARERAQMPLSEKARRAHHTLNNAGSPDDLRRQVEALLERWGIGRACEEQALTAARPTACGPGIES